MILYSYYPSQLVKWFHRNDKLGFKITPLPRESSKRIFLEAIASQFIETYGAMCWRLSMIFWNYDVLNAPVWAICLMKDITKLTVAVIWSQESNIYF